MNYKVVVYIAKKKEDNIMYFKLVIISVILVAFVMLALGIKLWFNPKAEFSAHSCAFEDGSLDKEGACSKCQLQDLANCQENKDKLLIKR